VQPWSSSSSRLEGAAALLQQAHHQQQLLVLHLHQRPSRWVPGSWLSTPVAYHLKRGQPSLNASSSCLCLLHMLCSHHMLTLMLAAGCQQHGHVSTVGSLPTPVLEEENRAAAESMLPHAAG
jgi:hypothetical protein